jgi:hypothetical protein
VPEAGSWCPKCGAEYRSGFSECADCHVPLVADPPPVSGDRSDPKGARIVELTRAPRFEAELIVARLRAEEIEASLGADAVYGSLTFAEGVPVFVRADDLAIATSIIEADDRSD